MKQQKIYMQTWLDFHGRAKATDTDQWYLDLANNLLLTVRNSRFYAGETEDVFKQVSLLLALCMEDCVADAGSWRQFTRWHQKNYGRHLPFYALSDDYLEDEINREDIALLIWAINSPVGDDFDGVANPLDDDLLEFANHIYTLLNDVFEEAPISDWLAGDWFMEYELLTRLRTPLPVTSLDEKMPMEVERFLQATEGEPLMFFNSHAALKQFFVLSVGWEDSEDGLLPDLKDFSNFVVYANQKGFLIGPDVAPYFADKRNTLYNASLSEEEAYELFCEQGLCPFDLLKYGMEHHLLPDAQFPFEDGKQLFHENWDFVTRWFLGDYYEAE